MLLKDTVLDNIFRQYIQGEEFMPTKHILITGASRGIGKATALHFAKRGYHVFLNSNRSREDLSQLRQEIIVEGGLATLVPGDVSRPDEIEDMFSQIHKQCPGLDVLVNNAGLARHGLFTEMTNQEWSTILDVNLSSVFHCTKAALPYMVKQKNGKIINVSSIWGEVGASCEVAYSTAKAGVNGLTKALAKELAPSNIQVNAVACGVIDTVMNAGFSENERKALENEIPACRFGRPEEVAELIYDLAEKHSYLTGQVIRLDGGYV